MTATTRDEQILVFDAGTQSIRAALIDLHGEIQHMVKTPFEPYFSRRPGWAEQEPDFYWQHFADTSRQLLSSEGVDPARIAGVAVTSQRNTMVNLDKDGTPLRPAILWLDQRKADMEDNLAPLVRGALKALQQYGVVEKAVQECKILD